MRRRPGVCRSAWQGFRRAARVVLPYAASFGILFPPAVMPEAWRPLAAASAQSDTGTGAVGDATAQRLRQLGQRMQRAYNAMRVARQRLPRASFDLEALSEQLGEEPPAAFAWVRDHTRFVAYRGELRGARGVLIDRMGSHLDRALLLAELLQLSGHEVRLARAELSEDRARELIDITTAAGFDPAGDHGGQDGDLQAQLALAAQLLDQDRGVLTRQVFEAETRAQQLAERVVQRSLRQRDALAKAIGWDEDAVGEGDAPSISADTLAALRDHWWVRVNMGGEWIDLDPARRDHEAGDMLAAGEPDAVVKLDAIPDADRHRMRVELVTERATPDGVSKTVVLSHATPVAAAVADTVSLTWQPMRDVDDEALFDDAAGRLDAAKLRTAALEEKEWKPVLRVGDEAITRVSVRADGTINQNPGEGMAGRKFAAAIESLGDGQNPDTHFTAAMLRFTIDSPGPQPVVIERPVFDLVGPAQRAGPAASFQIDEAKRLERNLALLGSLRALVQPCRISPAYSIERLLADQMANRQARLGMIAAASRGDFAGVREAMKQLRPRDAGLLNLAAQRFELSPVGDAVALDRVNLLGYVRLPRWNDGNPGVTEGFDIIENAVAVLPGTKTDPRRVRLTQGVTDTVLEAELVTGDRPPLSAAVELTEALTRGVTPTAVRDAGQVHRLGEAIGADVKRRIADAIAAGRVVVLADASGAATTEGKTTWWRIDPDTGACLGLGPDGRGTATTGYSATQTIGFTSTLMTIAGGLSCVGQDPDAMACCMAVWGAGVGGEIGLARYLGGGVAGAAIALGAALVFSVATVDVTC